jgi:DNA-binding transcriptional LysR family regulator
VEFRHLRYFLAVAETLNISEAARRLRVAQPSLSRQVRDLEDEIGHPLFRRNQGRLSFTAAGTALRRHAALVIADVDTMLAQVRNVATDAAGELRVGYYATTWSNLLAPALPPFRRLFPKVLLRALERTPAQIMQELKRGELDVGILIPGSVIRSRDYVATRIGAVPGFLALPTGHPLAKRRALALAELRGQTFLSYAISIAPDRDRAFIAACRRANFKPRLLQEANGLPALLLGVAQNRGVAIVSVFATRLPHPGVVFSRIKPPGVPMEISVAYRRDAPAAARQLTEMIATEGRKHLGQ